MSQFMWANLPLRHVYLNSFSVLQKLHIMLLILFYHFILIPYYIDLWNYCYTFILEQYLQRTVTTFIKLWQLLHYKLKLYPYGQRAPVSTIVERYQYCILDSYDGIGSWNVEESWFNIHAGSHTVYVWAIAAERSGGVGQVRSTASAPSHTLPGN